MSVTLARRRPALGHRSLAALATLFLALFPAADRAVASLAPESADAPPSLPAPASVPAPATTSLPFGIPGHGRLLLAVPAGWWGEAKEVEDPAGLALRFGPVSGASFAVQVTVFAPPRGPTTPEQLREAAKGASDDLAPHSVEESPAVEELQGPFARLAFASATDREWVDRAPPEGEWRYVTRGGAGAGPLLAVFTILTDGRDAPGRAAALEMLRTARAVPAGEGPSALRLVGGGRALTAELPGLEVLALDALPGGAGTRVMGSLPGSFMVTLTIERAPEGMTQATEVREARWTNGAAKTPAEKTQVRLSSREGMEMVSYLIPAFREVEIRQKHVHGYLAGGGAIGEVHLSKVRHEPGDDAGFERILATVRLQ